MKFGIQLENFERGTNLFSHDRANSNLASWLSYLDFVQEGEVSIHHKVDGLTMLKVKDLRMRVNRVIVCHLVLNLDFPFTQLDNESSFTEEKSLLPIVLFSTNLWGRVLLMANADDKSTPNFWLHPTKVQPAMSALA